jgi:hypothetical protein
VQQAATTGLIRLSLGYGIYQAGGLLSTQFTNPGTVPRGKRLDLRYLINSGLDMELPVWLGANLAGGGQCLYNVQEDAEATLRPGENIFKRFLTVARE